MAEPKDPPFERKLGLHLGVTLLDPTAGGELDAFIVEHARQLAAAIIDQFGEKVTVDGSWSGPIGPTRI